MKLRLFLSIILSGLAIFAYPDNYTITQQEAVSMLNEAEDWIDDRPDGLQDKISDAVLHSMRGFFSEINYFRELNPSEINTASDLKITELNGSDPSLNIRVYTTKAYDKSKGPVLIFYHGGGWSMGSVFTVENFCKKLASGGKVAVVSMSYPLAPETTSSAIIKSCESSYKKVVEELISLKFNPANISIGGEGAGGNLALSVTALLKKEAYKYNPKSIVLYYPLLSTETSGESEVWKKYGKGYGLDRNVLEAYTMAFTNAAPDDELTGMLVSPLWLPSSMLKNLPPLLIISAERDIVIDQQKDFVGKIKKLGVNIRQIVLPGVIHGFISDNHQPTALRKSVELTTLFLVSTK